MQNALGLHPHPQLKLVGGHIDEIGRHILGGEGVHARAARPAVNPVELILDQYVALLSDEPVEVLLQLAIPRGLVLRLKQVVNGAVAILHAHLAFFQAHFIAHAFLRGDDFQVLLIVLSADGGRPLEHHVLEEVRNAGDAEAFVGAPDVRHPAARDGRFIVPFDQQKPHPIAEILLDDGDFLRRQWQRPGQE